MAAYGAESRLSAEEASHRALSFFGPAGLGLEVIEEEPCCLFFKGGGGHVRVSITPANKKSHLEIETTEWDIQVKKFIQQIG